MNKFWSPRRVEDDIAFQPVVQNPHNPSFTDSEPKFYIPPNHSLLFPVNLWTCIKK